MSLSPIPPWLVDGVDDAATKPAHGPGASRPEGRRSSDVELPPVLQAHRARRAAGRGPRRSNPSSDDVGRSRLRRAFGGMAVAAVLLVAYLVIGPSQLGGPATYVVTAGNSMEPMMHRGDLAIARKRSTYAVGDVVLYRSNTINENVLHRIVGRKGDRLVTRGDHNTYDDPENPSIDQVRGELWFHVPKVGAWLSWFQKPLHAALFLGVLVLLAMGGGGEAARRRGRRPVSSGAGVREPADGSSGQGFQPGTIVVGAGIAAALFAFVTVTATGRPETRTVAVPKAYAHEGTFGWSASTWKSVVYPDGKVENGEPVFTKLVRDLDVAFTYHLESRPEAEIFGGVRIDAVVSDNQGWSRRLPVAPQRAFKGNRVTAVGTLDVRRLVGLVARMQSLTGSPVDTYKVTLEPKVEVTGVAGSTSVDESFAPTLALTLDPVALRLDPAAGGGGADTSAAAADASSASPPASPMQVTEAHDGTRVVPTTVSLGPVSLAVADARRFGLLGLVVSLLVAAVAALVGRARRAPSSDLDRALAEHADRIVPASVAIGEDRWVTEIADVRALLLLAERYDRVVLHEAAGDDHVLVVDDGVAVYRCRASSGPHAAARMSPART